MDSKLPLPTEEQYEKFAQHICWAHSWYKHIPLFDGAEFIFFLSEFAGGEFSEDNPRLHYSWTTRDEYRQRFGYLDYVYRITSTNNFYRDYSPGFLIRPEMPASCAVTLYPFVSNDMNAQEVLSYFIETEYIEQLRVEDSYQYRQAVLDWFNMHQKQEQLWQSLSETEEDIVMTVTEFGEVDLSNVSLNVAEYLKAQKTANKLYCDLQDGELCKIRATLNNLRELAVQGFPVWH